jgi:hypothetical protein
MKPEDIAPESDPSKPLAVSFDELSRMKRDLRKHERARLRGVFIPNQGGPNRKQRRANRG